jgi:hypothetical protein
VAKVIRQKGRIRKTLRDDTLPLSRENFLILGVGLAVIALGYLAMIQGSVEGFLPLVAAPVLLVAGYCVIMPIGILYRKRQTKSEDASSQPLPHQG